MKKSQIEIPVGDTNLVVKFSGRGAGKPSIHHIVDEIKLKEFDPFSTAGHLYMGKPPLLGPEVAQVPGKIPKNDKK